MRTFQLTRDNVVDYLQQHALVSAGTERQPEIFGCSSKNFNLVVRFNAHQHFLVKQKRLNSQGEFSRDFYDEWRVYDLLCQFPDLSGLTQVISEVLHHDAANAILVSRYFPDFGELEEFHTEFNRFPPAIGRVLGEHLGTIHRLTDHRQDYCGYLIGDPPKRRSQLPRLVSDWPRIRPSIFGNYCGDALEFFRLLQQSALAEAIAGLADHWQPSCLVHRDLKLDNILIKRDWAPDLPQRPAFKIIDWELYIWGDPIYDLATVLGSYLKLWLESIDRMPGEPLQQALKQATTPLGLIQPLIVAFLQGYCHSFPQLLQRRSEFWTDLLQISGFYLLRRIAQNLTEHYPYDFQMRRVVQVAQRLIMDSASSAEIIFGMPVKDLEHPPLLGVGQVD
ncbi:phosphotransferase family protein [Lyngbya confervoides]|uniref:Aminoglycoside phosphotransferase family protein n=1 Tax=Lyngbya confervoides BDU141951 TaxID=1574623 RepID=A0ABD4T5H0_9CYAN|nr:aminoglycoside phosphotransferase family protein [Lyngbya confervoides]MCM1983957.1 aminoglycoside phosphotransferase family protein [Lyngbya confervoides BDU141951]